MHFYLAQWEWYEDPTGGKFWRGPGGTARSVLDVRTFSQMAAKGGSPEGWGFFRYEQFQVIAGAVDLGNDPSRSLTAPQVAELRARLGMQFESRTSWNLLWDLLTTHSDPTGASASKPLIADRRGNVELRFGGLLRREGRNAAHRAREIAVFQHDYKRNRAAGVPLEALRRWTGGKMQRIYGRQGPDLLTGLLPSEHIEDGWKPPTTTITDDFNRGDSTNLGANWTEIDGDLSIISNQIGPTVDGGVARHDTALSSDDHYSQVEVTDNPDGSSRQGSLTRKDNTGTLTYYRVVLRGTNNQVQMHKIIADSGTQLGSNTAVSVSIPDTIKLESDGSTQTCYWNGESKISETDSAISGNLYCGVTHGLTGKSDDFEAADLGAATTILSQMMAHEGG